MYGTVQLSKQELMDNRMFWAIDKPMELQKMLLEKGVPKGSLLRITQDIRSDNYTIHFWSNVQINKQIAG